MKRRILGVLAAALLLLSLCACAGTEPSATAGPDRTTPALSGETDSALPANESTSAATESTNVPAETEAATADTPETESRTEPEAESPTEPEAESPTEPEAESRTEAPADPEPQPSTEEETSIPTEIGPEDFADEESLREFLIGAWNFYPTEEDQQTTSELGGIPGLTIQFGPDGSFFAIHHMNFAQFTGTWTLDRLYADADELPDWLCCSLDEPGEDLWSFGDYVIQGWAYCRGSERLSLVQVNNGDSVFSTYFDRYDVMLSKGGDVPSDESADPKPDASFCAMVWEVTEDGDALWVTEVDSSDFSIGIGSREAVRYVLADDCEIRCPTSAFAPGGLAAEIETNSDGEISMINWAEPEMEENG